MSRTALAAGREQAIYSQVWGSPKAKKTEVRGVREPRRQKSRNRQPSSWQVSGVGRVRGAGAWARVEGAGGAGCAHHTTLAAAFPRGDRWSSGGGWALGQSPEVLSPRGRHSPVRPADPRTRTSQTRAPVLPLAAAQLGLGGGLDFRNLLFSKRTLAGQGQARGPQPLAAPPYRRPRERPSRPRPRAPSLRRRAPQADQ